MVKSSSVPTLRRIILLADNAEPGTLTFDNALDAGKGLEGEIAAIKKKIRMDDGANIQFTSGTTGNPKVFRC